MNKEKQDDTEQNSKAALINNVEIVQNILRILCMLEKALNRLARRNYYNRSQYPEIFFEIEEAITTLRTWIQTYQIFCGLLTFTWLLSLYIKELNELIGKLIINCKPLHGKKGVKKSSLVKEEKNLCNSTDSMLKHIEVYLDKTKRNETIITYRSVNFLLKSLISVHVYEL